MGSPAASGQTNEVQTARASTIAALLALIALAGCWQNALAPADSSILFRVTSAPIDPGISVTVYVKDLGPTSNRVDKVVSSGGEVLFDNLGAGFDIQVGVAYPVPTVTVILSCRSATIDLNVSGLPPGDSALVDFASPGEPQPANSNTQLVTNGSHTVAP